MKINNNPLIRSNSVIQNSNYQNKNFSNILNEIENNNKVKFSKHAKERIESRKIDFNKEEINKIENALHKAKQKGIKDSLILMNKKAVIANVASKTIITVTTENDLTDNIFTNIDGAVIL
jgi:flagellar operon protein